MSWKLVFIMLFWALPLIALEKVSIQLKWHHQFQFAGYYAAIEKGYYRDEGLEVTLKDRDPKINNIEQILNGESDYGISDSALLVYIAQKQPVAIVAPIFQHSPNVMITLKSSGIDSPYDMIGKRISMYPNDVDGLPLLAMLYETGVTRDGFSRIDTNFDINELITKKVDITHGYSTNEPYTLKQKNAEVNVIYPQNFGIDFYGDMLFTTKEELTNHPRRVEAMRRATIKGWEYAITHKEEIIHLIQTKYQGGQTTDKLMFEADGIIAAIAPNSFPIGRFNQGRLDYMQNMLERHGLLRSNISLSESIYRDAQGIRQKILQHISLDQMIYATIFVCILLIVLIYSLRKLKIKEEELKVLNLQVQHDKKRYQSLMENASEGVFIMNLEGKVLECSYQAAAILGYSMDEMKNLFVYDWDIAHTKEEAIEHVRNTPSVPLSFESLHKRKDASVYNAAITVVKIQIMDDDYIYASVRDITHEKELEKALLATNKKLTNISENIPGVIYTYQLFPDGRSCFPYASEHIFDVYGVAPMEVKDDATKVFNVLHPDDIAHVVETITNSQENLTIWEDEYRVNHPTKGMIWLKGMSKPEMQSDGSVLWYGYIHETTVQKQLEIELIEKKEAAEDSARSKSEFLAMMSHEIRTPMNGVLGMLSLLDRSNMDSSQHHQLHVAISSASSLLGLINDILDFSKIEAGKMDLEYLEFNLEHEIKEFAESMNFKVKEKGLNLILKTDEIRFPNIITDPGRFRQILTNLVGNALKFTSHGQITLSVSLQPTSDQRGHLHIDVIDTGIGISSIKIAKLFDPFTQADGSTTRKFGGSGLGLSIVKRLCELMGGSISVTSTVDIGSTFSIDMDVELGSEVVATLNNSMDTNETFDEIEWPESIRILLVEDNPTNQIVAIGMLQSFGLSADIAGNGIEAIEAIKMATKTLPYTIVLMDCQMPEMDGYDATLAIRSGQAGLNNQNIPIIAMTANAMSGDREKCFASGMDDYIPKPVNMDTLKAMLMKWVLNKEIISPMQSSQEGEKSEPSLWDEVGALRRLGNNESLLRKVIESFMNDAPLTLKALQSSCDVRNYKDMQLHAHSLKGSSGNVGAAKLQKMCKKIEDAASTKEIFDNQDWVQECETILNETLMLFTKYMENKGKSTIRKKRFDPLLMAIKLQSLKKELEEGLFIDTETSDIFTEYDDLDFSKKIAKLKHYIESFDMASSVQMVDTIMREME